MQDIEWVRNANDLAFELPLPKIIVQGAVLGSRKHRDLGLIEFIASTTNPMVLIATLKQIYAISPSDPNGFIDSFNRNMEMGSIDQIQPKSSRGEMLVGSLFGDKLARNLILLGSFLSIGLLVAVSFIIPTRESIPLGFNPIGQTTEVSPSERLLLLPVLSLLMLFADLGLGSYLYRKAGYRIPAYFAFASSLIMPISFLGIIFFMIL